MSSFSAGAKQEDATRHARAWISSCLAAERAAISDLLIAHHKEFLGKLDMDLRNVRNTAELASLLSLGGPKHLDMNFDSDNGTEEAQVRADEKHRMGSLITSVGSGAVVPVEQDTEQDDGVDTEQEDAGPEQRRTSLKSQASVESFQDQVAHLEDTFSRSQTCNICKRIAEHWLFEVFFIVVILMNTFQALLEVQYHGFEIGYNLEYPGMDWRAEEVWPGMKDAFRALEVGFAVLYTIELGVKLFALRLEFFRSCWNIFDLGLVGIWYVLENVEMNGDIFNPMILRLFRLARIMRLLKHLGWFQAFDSLHILLSAIKYSFAVLVWSSLLLAVLFVISALVTSSLLSNYLKDVHLEKEERRAVYKYYGTFSRALVSMFEMAFASHVAITRTLMENVNEWWALYFLLYKTVVGLSIMKVISAVFMQLTFKCVAEDDELMILQKRRAVSTHTRKMQKLFHNMNKDGDTSLSQAEFEAVLHDDWVRTWLSAMEIDTSHAKRLWELLDDGDGELTPEELVKGMSKLKGPAKSQIAHHTQKIVDELAEVVNEMNGSISEMKGTVKQLESSQRGNVLEGTVDEMCRSLRSLESLLQNGHERPSSSEVKLRETDAGETLCTGDVQLTLNGEVERHLAL